MKTFKFPTIVAGKLYKTKADPGVLDRWGVRQPTPPNFQAVINMMTTEAEDETFDLMIGAWRS